MRVPGQPYEAGTWTGLQRKPGDDRDAPDFEVRRLIVERIHPEIDGGRFPIKRTVGESVAVTVDLFADGHDLVTGVLKYRVAGPPRWLERGAAPAPQPWTEVPLTELGDDRWGASFVVTEPGEYEYTVEGWIDRVATL